MRLLRDKKGQGMTEYIIIVALIAIAAIAAFTYFGRTVRTQTTAMTQALGGDASGAKSTEGGLSTISDSAKEADTGQTLKDYVQEPK